MSPPNNQPPSQDDPFGGLDPMAWLESLAKRQGANPDELTTAADLDVPMPDSGMVITGPGYVPYDTGSSKPAAPPAKAPLPAAPVASSPNADDPFGGLDPMAWLESLAKRQGANADELTTKADIDVPMPDANAKIEGPGYTPGYDVGPSGKKADTPPVAARPAPDVKNILFGGPRAAAEPQKVAPPPPPPVAEQPPPAPPPSPATIRFESPQPPPDVPIPAASSANADDPFGGLDPMAWLESLAKRQGANLDELTTKADIDVPMPDADAKIEGPGYTPGYDVGPSGKKADTPPPAPAKTPEPSRVEPPRVEAVKPPPPPIPEPVQPVVVAPAASVVPMATTADDDDPFGGLDPMAWLEALAKRQGANVDELVTGGNAEVPYASANAVSSEPGGYSDYSPFGQAPLSGEFDTPSMSLSEAEKMLNMESSSQTAPLNPLEQMDPIAWLESLSSQEAPGTDANVMTDEYAFFGQPPPQNAERLEAEAALDWLEQLAQENDLGAAPPTISTATVIDQGGLSDDPQEILRWLNQQTEGLADLHEIEGDAPVSDPIGTIAPGEIPAWLQEQMAAPEGTPSNALSDQFVAPPVPTELPGWLTSSMDVASDEALTLESLFDDALPSVESKETLPELSTSELRAITSPTDDADPWAEALDEEYQREKAGDVTVPDWYSEALERYGDVVEPAAEPLAAQAPATIESDLSWLEALRRDDIESAAVQGDIPAWLLEANPETAVTVAAPVAEVENWTSDAVMEDLPDWLKINTDDEPTPAPEPVRAPEPAAQLRPTQVIQLEPGIIEPARPAPPTRIGIPVQPPIAAAPVSTDLGAALKTAFSLVSSGAHLDSLPHFEVLINAKHDLDRVIEGLNSVVAAQPKAPRPRRLLGDAFMRRGDLQKALDTYRGALDQL